MKQNEPEKGHLKEYKFLFISGILLVSVISAYFFQFSFEGIGSQGIWGQFGDFMGGVLNPLLSFIVIWILVEDLKLTRIEIKNSLDEQKNATEAMKAQVKLLENRPNITFYPINQEYGTLIIKNIGDAFAYNLEIEVNGITIKAFRFIAPNHQISLNLWKTIESNFDTKKIEGVNAVIYQVKLSYFLDSESITEKYISPDLVFDFDLIRASN